MGRVGWGGGGGKGPHGEVLMNGLHELICRSGKKEKKKKILSDWSEQLVVARDNIGKQLKRLSTLKTKQFRCWYRYCVRLSSANKWIAKSGNYCNLLLCLTMVVKYQTVFNCIFCYYMIMVCNVLLSIEQLLPQTSGSIHFDSWSRVL